MVTDYLNALKTEKNLSWQEISNLSNIPPQTVRNIFSGETANPGITAMISIVTAMGGSLDEMAGIERPANPQKSPFEVMTDKYEKQLADTKQAYEARITQLSGTHEREIKQLTESNERRITELNASFERRIGELNENFERRIAENSTREEKRLAEADEREKRHFYSMGAIILLLLVAIFYLILDAMHGNWGIFQYSELLATMGNTGAEVSALWGLPV